MNLAGGNSTAALNDLLTVASAKFIMSLTGLLCSILFTILLRVRMGKLEQRLHRLCHDLETRLSFVSLEALAIDQLKAAQEQREHLRALAFEMVAELGRPLREELPAAISNSISTAMSPLLDQVSRMGTEGMGSIVEDLSRQFSGDVSRALSDASTKLAEAGARIGQLAERMDQSSGRMGAEMEQAVIRVAQSVEDLRGAMGATMASTSSALTQGAEQLLGVMNETLVGIRDNTGEGAKAMSAAAAEMREAASSFRAELEAASRSGAEAARHSLETAASEASRTVSDSFGKTSVEIAGMASALTERTSRELIGPIDAIAERLGQIVTEIGSGAAEMRRMSDAVRSGAEAGDAAAGTFRAASQSLVGAAQPVRETSERIEGSLRALTESTQSIAGTVSRSAERVAAAAAATLEGASQTLGAERRAIEAALAGLQGLIQAQKGQGDRLDEMDQKLGAAFETYRTEVEAAVQGMNGHVRTMSTDLNRALDTMRGVVDSLTEFQPQSRRA